MSEYSYRVDAIRNGARLKSLKAVTAPDITANASSSIKSSLGATFIADADIDLLNDELRPVQIIDGVEYSLGIFCVATKRDIYPQIGPVQWRVEAYDRGLYVEQTRTENILHLAAGTNYVEAIKSLLHIAGINHVLATPSAATLATDREDWDIGTSYLDIINTLLKEINYYSLWFTLDGYAVLRPMEEPGTESIKRSYNELEPDSRISREMQTELDIFDVPNVFICICSNPDLPAPLISRAENTSPISKLSIQARGRRIAQAINVDNIASQAELDKYARRKIYDSMTHAETVHIKTAKMPGNELNDIVGLNLRGIQGPFTEVSWSLRMAPGEMMTHTLSRRILI